MTRTIWKTLFGVMLLGLIWLLNISCAQRVQVPLAGDNNDPASSWKAVKQVAIIGAGSGGASAAYYLDKFSRHRGIRTNITVYERSAYIGGRSTTVNVYDDPSEPVELGASIFVKANKNLVSAAEEFGLATASIGSTRSEAKAGSENLGVWNGKEFVFTQNLGGYAFWNTAKLLWKYGWAPVRIQSLRNEIVERFLKMYEAPYFPFRSLSRVVDYLDLTTVTAMTGEQLLKEHDIGAPFSTDIIQASTRVNYGQNLGLIHGLETMVCMATDGAMAVEGGNWRIFDGMLRAAGAHVRLGEQVGRIQRNDDSTYSLSASTNNSSNDVEEESTDDFDTVILAAPLQFSDIDLSPSIPNPPDAIPYVKLQVTLFTSPHRLSTTAFNLANDATVPTVILTTLPPDANMGQRRDGVGPAGFFSISTLRTITNPSSTPPRPEFLYKIFSPEPLTSTFLFNILGLSASDPQSDISSIPEEDISWLYEKTWHSYPYLYPRVTFDDPQLDRDLWYTSGIESFISTMETSSLMGMNVARLVVDDWTEAT